MNLATIAATESLLFTKVAELYSETGPCHDITHATRVARLARRVCEGGAREGHLAYVAGLLHDVGRETPSTLGPVDMDHAVESAKVASTILSDLSWPPPDTESVVYAIRRHRFSSGNEDRLPEDESTARVAAALWDADQLDAIGLL